MQSATAKATVTIGDISLQMPPQLILQNVLDHLNGIDNANRAASPPAQNHPRVGTFWKEEGGVLLGIMRGEENLPDYFLIAPTDPRASNKLAYGGYGIQTPGADSKRDGMANTIALCNADEDHPAAQWARSLTIDGHSDLFLPALRELSLGVAIAPELFEQCYHWSSTQFSASIAYVQGFSDGDQYLTHKANDRCVRAVRRKLII